jgi:hypothetical protein
MFPRLWYVEWASLPVVCGISGTTDGDYSSGCRVPVLFVARWIRTRNLMNEESERVGQRFRICRDTPIPEPARNDGQKRKRSRRSGAPSKNPRAGI